MKRGMNIVAELIRDMSLWKPQKEGLEIFDRIIQTVPLARVISKSATIGALVSLSEIKNQINANRFDLNSEITGSEGTEFPSFCFAIATGGGKTRLMGACIAYLYY